MNKKIAIPTTNSVLSAHFGHCEKFAIYSVVDSKIVKEEMITPPPHEPGSHPKFLRDLGCETIIAGGMGERAQTLFAENNIEVFIGVPDIPLTDLVQKYIESELKSGNNLCDH
ncbi:MAG: NifB/NifX family molybdenum-iron cluster-binding protein [Candidatus Cloacimonetes bacterium]|nr:NifB/NifX family molybdenum-iron cluster-binding protein [Candidatus Cloacimonadota bacterium]